jgi:hypothetical protein
MARLSQLGPGVAECRYDSYLRSSAEGRSRLRRCFNGQSMFVACGKICDLTYLEPGMSLE